MPFPLDRFYHRGHTWAAPGSRRHRDHRAGRTRQAADRRTRRPRSARSPARAFTPTGPPSMSASGTRMSACSLPWMAKWWRQAGRAQGWFLRVRPDASDEAAFRHLLRGAEIRPWLMREMERLQLALSAAKGAPALADGGVPVADIAAAIRMRTGTPSAARCSCSRKSRLRLTSK